MAPSESGILIVLVIAVAAFSVLPMESLAQEETDEVIIEGRDKQPATSSFDYGDTGGDTVDYSNLGTKDSPRPEGASPLREPLLDRDTGPLDHGELERSETTAVDEFSTLELMLIGAGVAAVLIVI